MHMDQCTGPSVTEMDGLEQPKHSVWAEEPLQVDHIPCSLVEVLRPWNPFPVMAFEQCF